jgi:hypothetical protein
MGGKTKLPLVLPTPTAEKTMLFHTPQKEVGFAVTLTASRHSSSGKSVSRVVPLDIDFAQQKIGKGAFARSVSIVYSQLKYWWRYAKWKYNNKTWFYKSQRELSDELGMSEKTIWRCIKRLKELGLILVEKHHRQFWKQVYFYHLCYIPAVSTGDGASPPVSNPTPNKAASNQSSRQPQPRKNDGIQHKKTNPLEEIIKRANQHRQTGGGFGIGKTNTQPNHKQHSCRYCRGSGLVDNDRNIAIACDCEAGNKYRHIAPSVRDTEVLISAAA